MQVIDNPGDARYEGWVDDALAGFAEYRSAGEGVVLIPHTEVNPRLRGRGVASAIVQFALDDLRQKGFRVIPACPYVRVWIERHPGYADLVP